MQLAHVIELKPTKKQEQEFKKACGVSRFTYNWALDKWKEHYQAGLKPSGFKLKKIWNKEKPKWVYESPRDANSQPFANLQTAFSRFFKGLAKYPKPKKKKNGCSFYLSNDKFKLKLKSVILPRIGKVKLTEELRFEGKINSAVVSQKGLRWYISVQVNVGNYSKPRTNNKEVGIDVGLKEAITIFDGENSTQIKAPKPFKRQKKKIARLHRKVSRRVKGSNNRVKATERLRAAYKRLADIRKDFWHKITTKLCRENQTIIIEDFKVEWMKRNRKLAFTVADIGLYEFKRQLMYKSLIYRSDLVLVDRFFPSTQLCSQCGNKQKMKLSERTYRCLRCGIIEDRDINAAKNLRTVGLTENYACGQSTSGVLNNQNFKSGG